MRLLDEHRAHLHASGLSDETIRSARIYSATVAEAHRLGYPRKLAGICFPYPGTEISLGDYKAPYTRLRVDQARRRSPGQKYENPLKKRIKEGLTFYPYIPPSVEEHRKDHKTPIVITEGEKKALKLTQEGFPTIGLPGVFMFHDPSSTRRKNEDKPLHPELLRWQWRSRVVYACFDSDRAIKDTVAIAHERLCAKLTAAGALVHVIRLPDLDGLQKTGADDFLVRRPVSEFQQLMCEARPWEPFDDLLTLLPAELPVAALSAALAPAQRRLQHASQDERRVFTRRLKERYPALNTHDILDVLENVPQENAILPEIVINNRQTRDIVRDSWRALQGSVQGTRIFRHGGRLVMVSSTKGDGLIEIDANLMEALLNRAATWVAEKKDDLIDARVPPVIPRDMIALPDGRIPNLRALTQLPILRPDGSLRVEEGLDRESGLFLLADARLSDVVRMTPERPTPDERTAALAFLLEDTLGDFPFDSEASRAQALGVLLLPVVRHLISGPTPLHLIEAPSEGTGKSLFADVVSIVATGQTADRTAFPQRENEVNKTLTALLSESAPIILLDNVTRALDSESLAAALTSERWSARLLGQSRMLKPPNLAVWLATGNNPVLSREIARRSLRIRLDAGVEEPWSRDNFRHTDLRGWLRRNRGLIISAIVTLFRGWLDDGAVASEKKMGSFESYAALIGGVLESAGVPGFLSKPFVDAAVADPEETDWESLVSLWGEKFGSQTVGTKDLLEIAVQNSLLDLDESTSARSQSARIGRGLQKRQDRVYGSWQIVRRWDASQKKHVYLLAVSQSAQDHP